MILQRCKEALERGFYIRMTRKFGWSKDVLARQIDGRVCEESLPDQTNFGRVLTPKLRAQVKLAVRDEYFVDLLLFHRRLPKELKGQLPSPQGIDRPLEAV